MLLSHPEDMQKPKIAVYFATSLAAFCGASSPLPAQQPSHRTYKASAYVTVWSLPVFSRADVGYGSAIEQQQPGPDGDSIELEFCSGSIPERAHGLNRFGYVHELISEKDHVPVMADYIGAMTIGGNQTVRHGEAMFDTQKSSQVTYLAASEHIENHQAHSSLHHLQLPVPTEAAAGDIMRRVKAGLDGSAGSTLQEERNLSARTAQTFLYSIRAAIRSDAAVAQQDFIYVGKRYRLRTEKHADPAGEAELRKLNIAGADSRVGRLNGWIDNVQTHERTPFTIWYDERATSALPLRFEYHPKPYLRLVFDAQPEGRSPVRPEAAVNHASLSLP